jgi:hypothetical protein
MKIIITESQYNILSNFIKRRLTMEDLEWLDKDLVYHIDDISWVPDFNKFSYDVISSLLNEFVLSRKYYELPEVPPDIDLTVFSMSPEFIKVFDLYLDLIPFLEKKYKNRLYQAWKVKGRSR